MVLWLGDLGIVLFFCGRYFFIREGFGGVVIYEIMLRESRLFEVMFYFNIE